MRRLGVLAAGLAAVLLAAATLSTSAARTLVLRDEQGRPLRGYALAHYEGSLLNFVHPVSYLARPGEIVVSDENGRILIPRRVHVRRPLPLSSPPRLFVEQVYVPALHNAFGPVAPFSSPQPGVFAFGATKDDLVVSDLTATPDEWERSIRRLHQLTRKTAAEAIERSDAALRDHALELAGHLGREREAFLARYGEVERPRPPVPATGPADEARDQQALDEHWRRFPTWGAYLRESWGRERADLATLEERLRAADAHAP